MEANSADAADRERMAQLVEQARKGEMLGIGALRSALQDWAPAEEGTRHSPDHSPFQIGPTYRLPWSRYRARENSVSARNCWYCSSVR
jgi:hypothetical protein